MEAELRNHLIVLAQAFAVARKIELVTVARLATGDWRFFNRVQDGATFTARKYDEVLRWFAGNWPDGATWPEAVVRPNLEEVAD